MMYCKKLNVLITHKQMVLGCKKTLTINWLSTKNIKQHTRCDKTETRLQLPCKSMASNRQAGYVNFLRNISPLFYYNLFLCLFYSLLRSTLLILLITICSCSVALQNGTHQFEVLVKLGKGTTDCLKLFLGVSYDLYLCYYNQLVQLSISKKQSFHL